MITTRKHFVRLGLVSFPFSVTKYPDKSNLMQKKLVIACNSGYHPSLWEIHHCGGSQGRGNWKQLDKSTI